MDPNEIDWSELITRSLMQQVGREPTRADMERLIAELKQARQDPEGAGIGRQLRALGLDHLDSSEGLAFVQQVIDLTLTRLEELGVAAAAPETGPPDPVVATVYTARMMLEPFLKPGADHATLATRLRPRPEDYDKVFVAAYAGVAREAYERIWDELNPVPRPNAGQRELLLAAATSEKIRDEGAPSTFPGGFGRIRHTLAPGHVWLCWKFVKQGERLGMAFDGLVRIEDHWAWFPKCWRVLGQIDA
jgi:hypothetical protein